MLLFILKNLTEPKTIHITLNHIQSPKEDNPKVIIQPNMTQLTHVQVKLQTSLLLHVVEATLAPLDLKRHWA